MSDFMYQFFLDWLRRRDTVIIRTEDGQVLANGFRPRSVFEEFDVAHRLNKSTLRVFATSLLVLRRRHGVSVDEFLAEWGGRSDPGWPY